MYENPKKVVSLHSRAVLRAQEKGGQSPGQLTAVRSPPSSLVTCTCRGGHQLFPHTVPVSTKTLVTSLTIILPVFSAGRDRSEAFAVFQPAGSRTQNLSSTSHARGLIRCTVKTKCQREVAARCSGISKYRLRKR